MTGPPPPFRGLWRNLTSWNVLEFKGPTVSPRRGHIESLVELGLGIDRQLRARAKPGQRRAPDEMSFWYLANRLGRRFLHEAERLLGELKPVGAGLWRSEVLGRLVFLVSSIDLPVEVDSLPLHIVGQEPLAIEREVAHLVAEQAKLQQLYGGWMASLHQSAWKEVEVMVRKTGKGLILDVRPAIESLGLGHVIEQVGTRRVIEEIGMKRVIEEIGSRRLIEEIGLKNFLADLSPAERRELKRQLQ